LFGRARAVLTFANVFHFLANEFASLRRRRFAGTLVLTSSFDGRFLGHKDASNWSDGRNGNATTAIGHFLSAVKNKPDGTYALPPCQSS
jgi:hypothetical protein